MRHAWLLGRDMAFHTFGSVWAEWASVAKTDSTTRDALASDVEGGALEMLSSRRRLGVQVRRGRVTGDDGLGVLGIGSVVGSPTNYSGDNV